MAFKVRKKTVKNKKDIFPKQNRNKKKTELNPAQ